MLNISDTIVSFVSKVYALRSVYDPSLKGFTDPIRPPIRGSFSKILICDVFDSFSRW